MTENDSKRATNRPRSYSFVTPLLFAGMLFALAGNVYQALRAAHFEHHVDLMHKNTQREIADVKEAVSGVLEQNLLRYDELNKQLQGVSAAALEKAQAEVKRSRSELEKTVEQRHQDIVTQLSDLRSDLREDTASKLSQISRNLERTGSQLQGLVSDLDATSGKAASNSPAPTLSPAVAQVEPPVHEQIEPAPARKQFWGKLNPFKYTKKKAGVSR